jgi:hypothetical protein
LRAVNQPCNALLGEWKKEFFMKNNKILLAILAIALVFGMTACGDGGGGTSQQQQQQPAEPTSTAYQSKDSSGNVYILEIIKKGSSRAAYTPQNGDTYVLTIVLADGTIKTSEGTVDVSGSGSSRSFTLTPTDSDTSFTITTSGENMNAISGTITFTEGDPIVKTEALTPVPVKEETGKVETHCWDMDRGGTGVGWELSDITPVIPKQGYKLHFRVSGTVEKTVMPLKWLQVELYRTASEGVDYQWLGASEKVDLSRKKYIDDTFVVNIWNDATPPYDIHVGFGNQWWNSWVEDGFDSGERLPANIKDGDVIMAFSNFNFKLVRIDFE